LTRQLGNPDTYSVAGSGAAGHFRKVRSKSQMKQKSFGRQSDENT